MMTDVATALYNFWSSFDLPAYIENSVPDEAELPYITYDLTIPDWRDEASITATIWYADSSYKAINAKTDEVAAKIGKGLTIPTGNGMIVIYKDSTFAQDHPSSGTDLKGKVLNMILMVYTD